MAKKPVKSAVKGVTKPKPVKKSTAPSKTNALKSNVIEKINEECLSKLIELNIEQGLQAEIQWCLGSYRSDKNPIGLYTMAGRALAIFKALKGNHAKLVSAKFLGDIEKALKSR